MRYFNPIILIIFLGLSVFAGFHAYWLMNQPIILDYFYNPTLKMYEPVEVTPQFPLWIKLLIVGPTSFISYLLWGSPWWFKFVYFPIALWLLMVYILSQFNKTEVIYGNSN